MFVVPKPAVFAAIMLVMCQMCCSHGYSPNQGTPPIVFQGDTMNQVGGEFKTKIGNVRKMPVALPPNTAAEGFASEYWLCCGIVMSCFRKRFEHSDSRPGL